MKTFNTTNNKKPISFSYPDRILYPAPLQKGDRIAITAPSSGLRPELHHLMHRTRDYLKNIGYEPVIGESVWTDDKCVSLPMNERATELERFLLDEQIKAIIPPWGGEFLMELLPLLNWELIRQQPPKWILGFSDISTLSFVYTLQTGYATAHGPSGVDISGADDLNTVRWQDILTAEAGEFVEQSSSAYYQSQSDYSRTGFNLDTPTYWQILGYEEDSEMKVDCFGRLLGGCLDVIHPLVGTPWSPVTEFMNHYSGDEGFIWYLESCEMNAADIYRHLWQLKQAGWFKHTSAVLFGRPAGYSPVKNFELTDALQNIFGEMNIPVIYNVDIGHIPPQLTLVNGAQAQIKVNNGKGIVIQHFT